MKARILFATLVALGGQGLAAQSAPRLALTGDARTRCPDPTVATNQVSFSLHDLAGPTHPLRIGRPAGSNQTVELWLTRLPPRTIFDLQPSLETTLRFTLEPSGKVDLCSAEVLSETSEEWTGRVLYTLSLERFQPATVHGRPARAQFVIRFVPVQQRLGQ